MLAQSEEVLAAAKPPNHVLGSHFPSMQAKSSILRGFVD